MQGTWYSGGHYEAETNGNNLNNLAYVKLYSALQLAWESHRTRALNIFLSSRHDWMFPVQGITPFIGDIRILSEHDRKPTSSRWSLDYTI